MELQKLIKTLLCLRRLHEGITGIGAQLAGFEVMSRTSYGVYTVIKSKLKHESNSSICHDAWRVIDVLQLSFQFIFFLNGHHSYVYARDPLKACCGKQLHCKLILRCNSMYFHGAVFVFNFVESATIGA